MSKKQTHSNTPITEEELRITDASSRKILSVHQSHTITFSNKKGDIVGTLDFNGDRIKFNGYTEHSAQPFIEFITNAFNEKIRTGKQQYTQAKVLEALEREVPLAYFYGNAKPNISKFTGKEYYETEVKPKYK